MFNLKRFIAVVNLVIVSNIMELWLPSSNSITRCNSSSLIIVNIYNNKNFPFKK